MPLWKHVRSNFSFGECTRSSSSAKPTRSESMPSTLLKSATIGIEPPAPTVTALLAPLLAPAPSRALSSAGLSNESCSGGARPKLANSTLQSAGIRARTKARKASRIFSGSCSPTRRNETLADRLAGDDGLGALAGIAADDAVDLGGRPRGDLLDQHAVLLAGRNLQPDLAEELLGRQVERGEVGLDVGRQFLHAVIEAGNGDAAVVVPHRAEDFGRAAACGFCAAPPNRPECRSRSAQVTLTSS